MSELILLALLAADAPATVSAVPRLVTPVISAELRAKFWRADSERSSAQSRLDAATAKYNEAVSALNVACGASFQPSAGPDGEPVCVPKPKAEAKK